MLRTLDAIRATEGPDGEAYCATCYRQRWKTTFWGWGKSNETPSLHIAEEIGFLTTIVARFQADNCRPVGAGSTTTILARSSMIYLWQLLPKLDLESSHRTCWILTFMTMCNTHNIKRKCQPQRELARERARERARESQKESQREPELARQRTRESHKKPERVRESQRESQREPEKALCGSLWLYLVLFGPHPGWGIVQLLCMILIRPGDKDCCPRCGGRVFQAERVLSAKGVYHRFCISSNIAEYSNLIPL